MKKDEKKRTSKQWERRRFLTLVFSSLIVGIFFFVLEEGEGVDLCFGGKRRETVEEIERVCILFVKCGDLGSGEPVWPLA